MCTSFTKRAEQSRACGSALRVVITYITLQIKGATESIAITVPNVSVA